MRCIFSVVLIVALGCTASAFSQSGNGPQATPKKEVLIPAGPGAQELPIGQIDPSGNTVKALPSFIDGIPLGITTPAAAAVTTLKATGLQSFDIRGPITSDGYQQYGIRTNVTNTGTAGGYGDRFACFSQATSRGFDLCRSSLMFDMSDAPQGAAYQSMWLVHVSPNDSTHTWSAIDGEVNMTNRGDDKGYTNLPNVNRFVGGLWFVPEATAFGHPGHARNVDFAWGIAHSGSRNDLNKYVKSYNGFIIYPDSIAPGGRAFVARGATDAVDADNPYSPLEMLDTWQSGIHCDRAHFQDSACLTLSAEQSIRVGDFQLLGSAQPDRSGLLLQGNGRNAGTISLQNNAPGNAGENSVRFLEPKREDGTVSCERGAIGYGRTKEMFVRIGDLCGANDNGGTSFAIVNARKPDAGQANPAGKLFTQFLAAEDGHFEWRDITDTTVMSLDPVARKLRTPDISATALTVTGTTVLPFRTPASSSEKCTQGEVADDTNYHYVCVAPNTWKRVALQSF